MIDDHVLGVLLGDLCDTCWHRRWRAGPRVGGDVLFERLLDAIEHRAGDANGTSRAFALDQGEELLLVAGAAFLFVPGLRPM